MTSKGNRYPEGDAKTNADAGIGRIDQKEHSQHHSDYSRDSQKAESLNLDLRDKQTECDQDQRAPTILIGTSEKPRRARISEIVPTTPGRMSPGCVNSR